MRALMKRSVQTVALLLALLGVTARALVPDGFMPASEEGRLVLVFCTAQGAQTRLIDLGGAPKKAPLGSHHDQCPFGFALSMGALPTSNVALTFAPTKDSRVSAPYSAAIDSSAATWYFSRGPPTVS